MVRSLWDVGDDVWGGAISAQAKYKARALVICRRKQVKEKIDESWWLGYFFDIAAQISELFILLFYLFIYMYVFLSI